MNDFPAEARPILAESAAASGADLDAQIRAAELAVIARDERVRRSVDAVRGRVRRKSGGALALTGLVGGAALLLTRFLGRRQKPGPASVPDAPHSSASPLLKALVLLLPFLPGAAQRALPGAGSGPGRLIALVLPMLGHWLSTRSARVAPRRSAARTPVLSAAHVDLPRYLGRWYEVARMPTPYQKHCAADVMASYTRAGRRLLSVLNSCRDSTGRMTSVRGVARVVPGSDNSRFRISFAPRLLRALPLAWRDYWVLMVDADYRYALAGTPDRHGLWLLSRTPALSAADEHILLDHARAQGYDTAALISTPRLGADDPD